MNDDVINNKVQLELKMEKALALLPGLFAEFAQLTGRRYTEVDVYGDPNAATALVALNTAGEAAKDAVDLLAKQGKKVKVIMPLVLRPWPEKAVRAAIGTTKKMVVAERVSQYGAGNYMANEIAAVLQPEGNDATIIQRTYGLGGLTFYCDDALYLFDLIAKWPNVDDADEKRVKWYYGAWPGDVNYNPPQTIQPITAESCTLNGPMGNRVNYKELSKMPMRFDKHSACPGCGIFTNLNLFLRGIDGHVVFFFNTGCGMVVTTGYPLTSFKVPYVHNLFHNNSSTATGVIEMYKRFKRQGKIKEDITFVCVSGDGGDDIGMDQVIGAALRNDPMIFLEYDNKGYMNTGGQLCYTGFKGELNSNAPKGKAQTGKQTHHKDIIEILRGTFPPYLFQAAESDPMDMIRKARKAQATVRAGGFAFGKLFSVCPLNWAMEEDTATDVVDTVVNACLHPLFEVEHGVTKINYDPEAKGRKVAVTEAFKKMGRAFSHITTPAFAEVAASVQTEVDRRWARLKAMSENPVL
jgi:pyruvate ferredoxin oxidoreductase alpha subunit